MAMGTVCSHSFYIFLNLSTYLIMVSINDNFYTDFSIIYHIFFIFFCSFSFFLLLRSKKGPGYLEKNSSGNIPIDESIVNNNENKNISMSDSPLMIPKSELLYKDSCDICKITNLPLRSHHCKRCGRCVLKYDHHCSFTGTCIGENNHLNFIIFLFFQSIALFLALYGLFKTLAIFFTKNSYSKFTDIPPSIFFYIFFLLIFFGYVLFLFFFHTYLICTNQTSYEIYHREKCPYIDIFRKERNKILELRGIDVESTYAFHPFDSGVNKNFTLCLNKFMDEKYKINWDEIFFENLKTNTIYRNCCDNEYWSCC